MKTAADAASLNLDRPWHALAPAEAASALGTDADLGLTWSRARASAPGAAESGESLLRAAGRILWNQATGGVILVLAAATVVSLLLGQAGNAVGIGISIVFAVFFGFVTDLRAERSLAALRSLNAPRARVVREGLEHEIPAAELAAGDVLILTAGQIVAADGRLAEASDLRIDESLLTGESRPSSKSTASVPAGTPLADRTGMAYAGTTVLSGYGRLFVTAPPRDTELARVGRLMRDIARSRTPLEVQTEELGRQLTLLLIVLSAGVTALGLLRHRPLELMLETGVILAIAAIPEGLPAVTTVALAAGLRRMARAGSLVRRLGSIETLGSVSVVCTDKTGTLTENVMRVTKVVVPGRELQVTGAGYDPAGAFLDASGRRVEPALAPALLELAKVGALCNNAELESHEGWHIHGLPTEGALLTLAVKAGHSLEGLSRGHERLRELSFSSERKRMAVVVRDPGGRVLSLVKGAPGEILSRSQRILDDGAERPLAPGEREGWEDQARRLGSAGHRVLAFAYRILGSAEDAADAESGLVWLGLAGLEDPARSGVKEAIRALAEAGLKTVMVTGDRKDTAVAVARDLGLFRPGDAALDSTELNEYVQLRRWEDLNRTTVFCRVTPEDKVSVVRALKSAGLIVAMTGDGINDAPALKAADIGIAMGSKSADVAKEAADFLVTTGDFAALPAAVREGRRIYDNIRRSVRYLVLCSFATIWVMLVSVVTDLPLPLSPLQLLWLNLAVHIFPSLALALSPGGSDLMSRPPRGRAERLLEWRTAAALGLQSFIAGGAALWVFAAAEPALRPAYAQTSVMTALALTLLAQSLAELSSRRSLADLRRGLTPALGLALAGGLAVQLLNVYWPFLGALIQTVPLSAADWRGPVLAAAAALVLRVSLRPPA